MEAAAPVRRPSDRFACVRDVGGGSALQCLQQRQHGPLFRAQARGFALRFRLQRESADLVGADQAWMDVGFAAYRGRYRQVDCEGGVRHAAVTAGALGKRAISTVPDQVRKSLAVTSYVTRTAFPTNPPRVDYEPTTLGRSLWEPVKALGLWG